MFVSGHSIIRRLRAAMAGLIASLAVVPCGAQNVAWPAFGPERPLLRLDGFTDTLPDFVGPLDGSAELTIFTEGNHYPVLLPLVFEAFPSWCRQTGACQVDTSRILVVTLPQPMIVDMLLKGGTRLGNAVVPVGRDQRIFPDIVMGGAEPLHRLAAGGVLEDHATVFAHHRGLGLLLKHDVANIDGLEALHARAMRIVLASESEPGARNQYRATLDALVGEAATADLLSREVRTFPGRLGIQHRDVPYALVNDIADAGIIFGHLATFYARTYPERLRSVAVPSAARFGQELALARTLRAPGPVTSAFERFFLDAARTAYPAGGFAEPATFQYGAALNLTGN